MEKKVTNDPENYYNLSQPFENADDANKAISDFYDDVALLRKKHRIPDVLITIKGSVKYDTGVGDFMNVISFGNQLNQVPMAAYSFGKTQADQRELINKLATVKS